MIHQTMPDSFYGQLIGLSIIFGLLVERYWDVLILSDKHLFRRGFSDNKRMFFALLGLISAATPVAFMLIHWGVHNTFLGLNQLFDVDHWFGGAMWGLFGVFMFTTLVALIDIVRLIFFPKEYDVYRDYHKLIKHLGPKVGKEYGEYLQ